VGDEPVRMYLRRLDDLPLPDPPRGYAIRRLIPGEERAWWRLLGEAGDLGMWDAARAEREFVDPSCRVWKDSIHFALTQDRVVGTACVQLHALRDDLPELGWVAVAIEHRGHGLGRLLCLHVMRFMHDQGFQHCFIQTQSRRAAAVRLFETLGFQPEDAPHLGAFLERLPYRARLGNRES